MTQEKPWIECNAIMLAHRFSSETIRRSQIWAAKHRDCPKCHAPAGVACKNLTGIKRFGFDMARDNRYPHSDRVDWDMLYQTLLNRGYSG